MVWWQNLPPFWQSGVIILAGIVGGAIIGLFIAYVVLPRPKKKITYPNQPITAKTRQPVEKAKPPVTFEELVIKYKATASQRPQSKDADPPLPTQSRPAVINPAQAPQSKFVAEVMNNLSLAAQPHTDTLQPFQTAAWETNPSEEMSMLSENTVEEIKQAYIDMSLANNIVWLAAEVGRRSKDLDTGYIRLCSQIESRLNKVMPSLKYSASASNKKISFP